MRAIISFICAGLACATVAGCREAAAPDAAVAVVATTPQVADLVRAVGGERVAVTQILSPNSDPHEYEPRPSDAEALADADLIVLSGGDVDSWLEQIIDASGTDAPELSLLDVVRTRTDDDGEIDPHWWQDPRNAELAVAAIGGTLSDADPGGAAGYARRTRAYRDRLRGLDRAIAACMEAIPASERVLVSGHDALGYYADRYGIKVVGAAIPSLSTQGQSSAGAIADLVAAIRAAGVRAIFPEAGTSAELERAVAAAAGVRLGDELWTDTLGPAGSGAATYIEALRANTTALATGFSDGRTDCERELGS